VQVLQREKHFGRVEPACTKFYLLQVTNILFFCISRFKNVLKFIEISDDLSVDHH